MILKKIFKRIFLKTPIYDFYLTKNDLSEILITPHDPWPGDSSIGEKILQGEVPGEPCKFTGIFSPKKTL